MVEKIFPTVLMVLDIGAAITARPTAELDNSGDGSERRAKFGGWLSVTAA